MARLYANENYPLDVVLELRRLGHDVLTIQETGGGGQAVPDAEVLRFADSMGRAVITLSRRDFIRLHSQSADHHGIIVCSVDADSVALANRVSAAIVAQPTLIGRLLRINRPA